MDDVGIMTRIDTNRMHMRTAMSMLKAAKEELTNTEKQVRHMHIDIVQAIKMKRKALEDKEDERADIFEKSRSEGWVARRQLEEMVKVLKRRVMLFERDVKFYDAEAEFLHSHKHLFDTL